MQSSDQRGFILMVVVMAVLIVAVAGLALLRIQDHGLAIPSNPFSDLHLW